MVQLLNDTVNLTIYIKFFHTQKGYRLFKGFYTNLHITSLKISFFFFGIHDNIVLPDIVLSF